MFKLYQSIEEFFFDFSILRRLKSVFQIFFEIFWKILGFHIFYFIASSSLIFDADDRGPVCWISIRWSDTCGKKLCFRSWKVLYFTIRKEFFLFILYKKNKKNPQIGLEFSARLSQTVSSSIFKIRKKSNFAYLKDFK